MNYKKILILFLFFLLNSCEQIKTVNQKTLKPVFEKKYSNIGFTLVAENSNNIKNLDNRSFNIFHKSLKKKSLVKITNPKNGKSLIAEVKSNKVKFSSFYNSIITERIAEDLELDLKEPYIEILLVSKNSTFIAKKSKMFEEEKEVAEKAPVDGIQINDLNKKKKKKKKVEKEIFSYFIKIADFYYKNSAQLMRKRIIEETSLKNTKIVKLSKTKYRVLLGPFNDIKSMQQSFEKIKLLDFENIEILKNV